MFFKDVIGHAHVKAHLVETTQHERVAHAQMFLGAEGSGGLALALAYAQFLLCENPTPTDSCGICRACSKTQKFVHPDLHFSYPTVGTGVISTTLLPEWRTAIAENPYMDINIWLNRLNAENKQGNINKDECLDIVKKLSFKAFEGRYKILVMWLPEFLGKEGNRLLKLIEEPPEDTVFILIAEQQEQILNTILSRCQLVKVPPLSDDDLTDGLVRYANLSKERARSAAYLADGSLVKALELAETADNDDAALFLEWLKTAWQPTGVNIVRWVEKISGSAPVGESKKKYGRKDQKQFLQYGFHFLRETLKLMTLGEKTGVRLQNNELKAAIWLSQKINFVQTERIVALLNDCTYHIERNANPKILFLDVSIKLNKLMRGKS